MIQEFYVENFMSFGDRQYVSFEATSDKTYLEELTVEVKPGVRLLKAAILYGANASGKSNLLSAIQTLWHLLITPRDVKSKTVSQYKPFALRKGDPTVFGFTFYIADVKYIYEVKLNETSILSEKLDYVSGLRKALFYERTEDKKITFGSKVGLSKNSVKTIISNTLNNHSLLSTFAKVIIEDENSEYEKLFHWIELHVHKIDEHVKSLNIALEAQEDNSLKKFITDALRSSDFNITNFEIVEELEEDLNELKDRIVNTNILSEEKISNLYKKLVKKIKFTHSTTQGNFSLKLEEESLGTVEYFKLSRKIYDLIHSDCIYLIDEFEDSLHYDLMLNELLKFVRNSNHSQLIFSIHNQQLLEEDFIRRDMVKLVEKSHETAESQIYSASDFKLHKKLSLFNAYKIGKFGAKPELGSTLISNHEE
ncbi:MAG TPA: ATP-binding protein [Paludibacter sp.]|nr:ATP-binding protein [Paludibacter sp.]